MHKIRPLLIKRSKGMNYALLTVIFVALMAVNACTGGVANNLSSESAPATPGLIATPVKGEQTGESNECKVCDLDLTTYKGELKEEEIEGLLLALNDEYLATATYEQVNTDFNDPRPFVNIVQAERRHSDMLKNLFTKYGIKIPDNPWTGRANKFQSMAEACKAGVQGEIANRELYTRLFKTTERKDILDTYRYLQQASEQNHLPAFERCDGGNGPGNGRGNGRGPGGGR